LDKKDEKKIRLYDRRSFLSSVGIGCLGAACLGGTVLSVEFLSPNVVLEPSPRFNAGSVDLYPPDSVTPDLEHKVFVVRKPTGAIYTLSEVCTHLGCLTFFKQNEGIIACPCHGSKFKKDGEVIEGPAPRPLQRYFAELNDRSQLVIDKSQIVDDNFLLKV
jgi:cytochrome b6-f complex iron-sulfur subunit